MNIFLFGMILLHPSLVEKELEMWSMMTDLPDTDYLVARSFSKQKGRFSVYWTVYNAGSIIYQSERHSSKYHILDIVYEMEDGKLYEELCKITMFNSAEKPRNTFCQK